MEIKMRVLRTLVWIVPVAALLAGCAEEGTIEDDHAHDHGNIAATVWTDRSELFMEYPLLMVDHESEFLAYLTILENFKPVTKGGLTLTFREGTRVVHQVVAERPARDGVFAPVAKLPEAGTFDLEVLVEGPQLSERIDAGTVAVYMEGKEPHLRHDDELGTISFLKEQQWKIDFRTEEARVHAMKGTVRAVGDIEPKLQYHADVVSPVEGIVVAGNNHLLPPPGGEVQKGQVLAVISPPLDSEGGWTELLLAYDRAKAEYERAKRLREKKAISEKRYQDAWREYQIRKGSYEAFTGGTGGAAVEVGEEASLLSLKSPISGIVADVSFVPGQKIDAGQKMFTIIDPSKVWVSARVQEKDAHLIASTSGATVESVVSGETHDLNPTNSTILSIGDIVDSETHTLEVIFEVDNPGRSLKIGQCVRVELHTDENIAGVAVPRSAVYDEGGGHVVFVQREGETFERRPVRVGVAYRDLVQITGGLAEGERVVVVGGYQVKLASLNAEVGHGHTH
jgi:RND family efflux transporter MFP subunit